ncbi:MAG TPA: GNAT family N-acetyltransferase [Anaerolineales bacterium]|nr:GNAT family N-acetyltransferase [Anaerolineales bacterium]
MLSQLNLAIRDALVSDQQRIANLIHFEGHTHRNLDWRSPLDWLGFKPFLIAEQEGQVVGALACPPDPADVAWIRLFSSATYLPILPVWQQLWEAVLEQVAETQSISRLVSLPLNHWYEELLLKSNFKVTQTVVMLRIDLPSEPVDYLPPPDGVTLRSMSLDDLPAVQIVDEAAFQPIWRNSLASLEIAFRQANMATVAELDGEIIAYQITTRTESRVHLARLAVHPRQQGRHIGKSLLLDLLSQYQRRGYQRLTVNTQNDNRGSLRLYKNAGFSPTGEEYPIYEYVP